MRIRLDDCDPKLKARIQQAIAKEAGNRTSGMPAKRKQDSGDEPLATEEVEGHHRPPCFTRPVRITYEDRRKRLLDSDNGWTKYFTDALVTAGILRDDTPKEIPERPSVRQAKDKEEGLTITIEEIL